jgi:hypothetical protein
VKRIPIGRNRPSDNDFRLVLARKVTPSQAFLLLVLVIAAGSMPVIAAKTKNPWLGLAVVALAAIVLIAGRRTATAPISKTGPLWSLSGAQIKKVASLLEETARTVATDLQMEEANVRADVFAPDDGAQVLHMVPELTLRMTEAEKSLRIPDGFGCCGTCFQRRIPVVATSGVAGEVIYDENGEQLMSIYSVGKQESTKLAQHLTWIISVPIWITGTSHKVVGTLSVDGLVVPPQRCPDKSRLTDLTHHLVECAAEISKEILTE